MRGQLPSSRSHGVLVDVNHELTEKLLARKRKCAGIEVTILDSLLRALAYLHDAGNLKKSAFLISYYCAS